MAQLAMQQTINEITDYLATIDENVDDVLRGRKDAARQNRMELIARSTERLMAWRDVAVGTANTKVLLNPTASPTVVQSSGIAERVRRRRGDNRQGDAEQGDAEQGDAEQGDAEQGDAEQGDAEQGHTEQGDEQAETRAGRPRTRSGGA